MDVAASRAAATRPSMRSDTVGQGGLRVSGLAKAFGRTQVLRGIDLDVPPGSFVALLGASGCGKSTLLRIVAGLEAQDAGSVAIGGRRSIICRPPARRRDGLPVLRALSAHDRRPEHRHAARDATPEPARAPAPAAGAFAPRRRVMRGVGEEVAAVAEQLRIEALLDRRPPSSRADRSSASHSAAPWSRRPRPS
jgi:multiple sugar transport system ATP-binding protein